MKRAMRAQKTLVAIACLVGACCIAGCRQSENVGRTVVLISLDTTRPDHMTMYGYRQPTTPRLGELAADGIVFDQAIAVHSNTSPSHASMLTGLYPPSHGSLNNGVPISEGITTMAEILVDEGFATAAFVSGVTLKAENCGLDRGFDEYEDDFEGFGRGAQATLDRATSWFLKQRSDQDVFLFFHLYDPHFDYNPPKRFANFGLTAGIRPPDPIKREELMERLRNEGSSAELNRSLKEWVRRYDGEIAYADWAAGELLDALRKRRRYDEALIIMVSDHGETLTERPWIFDHGSRVTEEQIRVPMILKLPTQSFAGKRIAQPVSHIDILPTFLSYVGLAQSADYDGVDLRRLAAGEDLQLNRTLFAMARRAPKRMVEFEFTVPPPAKPGKPGSQILAARQTRYKLVDYGFMSPRNLLVFYDLIEDPLEARSVVWTSGASQTRHEEFNKVLEEWWQNTWRPEAAPTMDIPEETMEVLRALGYVE